MTDWYVQFSGIPLAIRVLELLKNQNSGRNITEITNIITNDIPNEVSNSFTKRDRTNLYKRVSKALNRLEQANKVMFKEELTPRKTTAKIYKINT